MYESGFSLIKTVAHLPQNYLCFERPQPFKGFGNSHPAEKSNLGASPYKPEVSLGKCFWQKRWAKTHLRDVSTANVSVLTWLENLTDRKHIGRAMFWQTLSIRNTCLYSQIPLWLLCYLERNKRRSGYIFQIFLQKIGSADSTGSKFVWRISEGIGHASLDL